MRIDRQGVAAGFSRAAVEYDRHAVVQAEIAERLAAKLEAPLKEGARVVDLGCGTGALALRLKALNPGAMVVGMDLALGMAKVARWKSATSDVHILVGDYAQWALSDSFDLVVSSCALQWSADWAGTLEAWIDRVKPGGRLGLALLVSGCFPEFQKAAARVLGPDFWGLRLPSLRELDQCLTSSVWEWKDLEVVEIRQEFDNPMEALRSFQRIGASFYDQPEYRPLPPACLRRLLASYPVRSGGGVYLTYRILIGVGRKACL